MQLAQGWSVNVDRGPDWLFAHLRREEGAVGEATELAENLWGLLQCHLSHRMVVELNDVPRATSYLLGQLVPARMSYSVLNRIAPVGQTAMQLPQ